MNSGHIVVSVIMSVHNGKDYLSTSLPAVRKSDYPYFELIVVDDNSTDGSVNISQDFANTVILLKDSKGPAKARNLGAKKSKGDILFFVDADVAIYPDSISKIVRELETHPEVSAVFGSYDDTPLEKNFFSSYKNLFHHFVHKNSDIHARTFWAGCGAVKRDIFLNSGGFPEVYSTSSIEDVVFGYKLVEDGKKIKLIVHRKGATRAFPSGHPEIPERYQEVGQPVLIPGTMGTASYVLVGTEKSKEAWYTVCHGAGRTMSRRAATRRFPGSEVVQNLEAKGIIVKCHSFRGIAEEAPLAYKDVDSVVNVVHNAGLSKKVAKLVPLAVIKGE